MKFSLLFVVFIKLSFSFYYIYLRWSEQNLTFHNLPIPPDYSVQQSNSKAFNLIRISQ